MADGLSTLSTEHLTAAVTSLLQKPLPDSHILPPHSTHAFSVSTRKDAPALSCQPRRPLDANISSAAVEVSREPMSGGANIMAPTITAVSQIVPPQPYQPIRQQVPVSQTGNQFNGKHPLPNSVQQNISQQQNRIQKMQNFNKLKFSVDNLHLASTQHNPHNQSQELSSFTNANIERIGQPLNESMLLGSLSSGVSVLQNLLNSHTQSHPNINSSMMFGHPRPQTSDNIGSFVHQLSPTQPIQNLLQSLFPQFDQTVNNTSHSSAETIAATIHGSELNSGASSVVQDSGINLKGKPLDSTVEFLKQQELIQKLQQNDVNVVLDLNPKVSLQTDVSQGALNSQGVLNTCPTSSSTIQDLQSLIRGLGPTSVQQFPFLLQPSTPGGPLQLVPLGQGLDLSSLQMLQQQLLKGYGASPSLQPVSPPISIQHTPPYLNIQPHSGLVPDGQSQISAAMSCVPTSTAFDVSMIQHFLNSQAGNNKDVDSSSNKQSILDSHSITTAEFTAQKLCQDSGLGAPRQIYASSTPGDATMMLEEPSPTPGDAAVMLEEPLHKKIEDANQENDDEESDRSMHDMSDLTDQTDTGDAVTVTVVLEHQVLHEDKVVFCVDCNRLVRGLCRVHDTDYIHVPDTPILTRAHASLPQCFTLQQTSTSEIKDIIGVWCKDCVSERTKFGPLVGDRKTIKTLDYKQQTEGFNPCKISADKDNTHVLVMRDENMCNWMMFVRMAHSLMEQNCVMYQDGEVFYIVTKTEIKEDEELLLWYSSEICQQMGISQNPGIAKMLECGECVTYFTSKKLRNSHLRSAHPDRYKWTCACPMCGKKFSANSKLNNHMMSHMGMKPHSCSFCGKQFSDASNLKTHMHIHTGEKKFRCDRCNKTFRQKAHLDTHLITHTGDKNHTCKYCNQSFARPSDLKTHTYRHTQELIYTCSTCQKVFYKTQNYKKHLKVHTGERNYMCNKCFKGFQTKYHRDRHLKICKEKNGKESSYMSLEEVAKLDNTCDVVPLKRVKADEGTAEQTHTDNDTNPGYYG